MNPRGLPRLVTAVVLIIIAIQTFNDPLALSSISVSPLFWATIHRHTVLSPSRPQDRLDIASNAVLVQTS